jgi:Flp pilus assembly protein TadG
MRELMIRLNRPRDERGVAAVFFALAITVLVASLGLSVDIGNVAYQRNKAQNAADTAARQLAQSCAKAVTSTYDAGVCSSLQASAASIAAKSFDTAGGTVTASVPAANQVKVVVSKDIPTNLLRLIGISSRPVSASATASALGGQPSEGYPVLPLGVSYCTWKNNSSFAGTSTEASHKIAVRTDTLQSLRALLSPLTGTLSTVLGLNWLLNALGTTPTDSCTDVDGTQLLTFQGGVWLTGENVLTSTLTGLFGYDTTQCKLNVGSDLSTFLGGVEGAAFFPSACASKFGPGKDVAVGKTILLPIYKPQSTLQNKYGFKLTACVGLGHVSGTPTTCLELPPKIGVKVVGFAPFTVTGWTFPSTPSGFTDSSVGCPAGSISPIDLYSLVNSTLTLLDKLLSVVTNLLTALLGIHLPTTSLACNGLQGYFTKSFTKDPNFTYTTGAANFGASYVKLTK